HDASHTGLARAFDEVPPGEDRLRHAAIGVLRGHDLVVAREVHDGVAAPQRVGDRVDRLEEVESSLRGVEPLDRCADQRDRATFCESGHERAPEEPVRAGDGDGHVRSPRYARYQATVCSSASSRVNRGAHPSSLRAFVADRYWLSISCVAVACTSGSNAVPAASWMRAVSSSAVSGVSVEKLNAWPTTDGSLAMTSTSCR